MKSRYENEDDDDWGAITSKHKSDLDELPPVQAVAPKGKKEDRIMI